MAQTVLHAAMPDRCRGCTLRGAGLCRAVARAERPVLHAAHLRRFSRDEMIIEAGEVPAFLGVLHSGYLRKERLRPDGRRTLLGLACPGELVGGLPGAPLAYTLEAATDAQVCALDAQLVSRMMREDSRFHMHVVRDAIDQHETQLDMIWRLGALSSRERIMAFLVLASAIMPLERLPDGSAVLTVELSRRDWADLSGTSVESISRTLTDLAEKDLVTTVAPNRYRIRNLALLTKLAGLDTAPSRAAGRWREVPGAVLSPPNYGWRSPGPAPSVVGSRAGVSAAARRPQ